MRSLPTKPVLVQPAKRQRNANPSRPMTHPEAVQVRERGLERLLREYACNCWTR